MAGISRTRRGTPNSEGMPSEGTKHRKEGRKGRGRARLAITVIVALLASMFALGSTTVVGAAPVGEGFTVSPADLSYILKQIKIAEAHVANTTASTGPCGALLGTGPDQIPAPELPLGLRTVDGSCNNLQPGQSHYGQVDQVFPRLGTPSFKPAESNPPAFGPPHATSYAQKKGLVFDTQPRTVSNLIVDQTSSNPAAVAASGHPVRSQDPTATAVPCDPQTDPPTPRTPEGCTPEHETLFIPNITTDVGLSPGFNSWFTLFGQFFDHGLDKRNDNPASGTVFVPLNDDDPLVAGPNHIFGDSDDLDPSLRFMVVTRSENRPGPDGIVGDTRPGRAGHEPRRHPRGSEQRHAVRRPEPDLHLAPVAPGLRA